MGGACLRPLRQPVYRRHDLITGFDMERGNLTRGAKGNCEWQHHEREYQYPRAGGGATHSSNEVAVTAMERRGCVILPTSAVNLRG